MTCMCVCVCVCVRVRVCVCVRDQTKSAVLNGNKILETFFYCKALHVVLMNLNSNAFKEKDS